MLHSPLDYWKDLIATYCKPLESTRLKITCFFLFMLISALKGSSLSIGKPNARAFHDHQPQRISNTLPVKLNSFLSTNCLDSSCSGSSLAPLVSYDMHTLTRTLFYPIWETFSLPHATIRCSQDLSSIFPSFSWVHWLWKCSCCIYVWMKASWCNFCLWICCFRNFCEYLMKNFQIEAVFWYLKLDFIFECIAFTWM